MKNKSIKILIFLTTIILFFFIIGESKVNAALIKSIGNAYVSLSNYNYVYSGNSNYPYVNVTYKGSYVSPSYYYVVYRNNINAGTAIVTIVGKGGGYVGATSRTFNISKVNLGQCAIGLSSTSYSYDGSAKMPTVIVRYNGNTISASNYSVVYSNNTKPGIGVVKIIGQNNAYGTVTKTFTINKIPIANCSISVSPNVYLYDGQAKRPTVVVRYGGTILQKGAHYSVGYSNNINAGTAQVTITGVGDYGGTQTKTFIIRKKSINNCSISLSATSFTYDGKAKKPTVTIIDMGKALNNSDYILKYTNFISSGTGKVIIEGKNNYEGKIIRYYTISKRDLTTCSISLSAKSFVYNGKEQKPTITVKANSKLLKEGKDYILEYTNNIEVGAATVKITGMGSVVGEISKSFNIVKRYISKCTATTLEDLEGVEIFYTGEEIFPEIVVSDELGRLVKDVDYELSYKGKRMLPGTYNVIIKGIGNYTGNKKISFEIKKIQLKDCKVTLSPATATYTGYAIKPKVTVYYNKKTLANTEYIVRYENNIKIGKNAKVIIEGNGKIYEGDITEPFEIARPDAESIFKQACFFHKKMEEEGWAYWHEYDKYTDNNRGNDLVYYDIEQSTYGTNITDCSAYVASVLYSGGVMTAEELNRHNYNNCDGLASDLDECPELWETYDANVELKPGDIVFFERPGDGDPSTHDHVAIYAGDGKWYDAGSTNSIRNDSTTLDLNGNNTIKAVYRLKGND